MSKTIKRQRLSPPTLSTLPMLLLAVAVLSCLTSPARANHDHPIEQAIVVNGKASLRVEPDQLNFIVGIDARAPTPSKAYIAVEAQMKEAIKLLKKIGVPDRDVQAMALSLQPVIDYKRGQEIIGHDARRDIAIRLDKIEMYGEVMEQLSLIDINRFQQLQL